MAWQVGWVRQYGGVVLLKKFAVKPALLGGLCLLGALLLAWFSPAEGVAGLFGVGARDGSITEVKTKVQDREDADGREIKSLTEEYLMKAERGMTEDEVRWVVEDFLALGLDVDFPEDMTAEGYLALRKAREEWYLGALVSGLRLTKEQEREARERMAVLRQEDYEEFVEYLDGVKSFEHRGETMMVIDGGKVKKLMDAESWMVEGYFPWQLCELDGEQLAVTNLGMEDTAEEQNGAEKKIEISKDLTKNMGDLYAIGLMGWGHVEAFFPYSRFQFEKLMVKDEVSRKASFLKYAKIQQPEQLKVLMLFDRAVVASLMAALDDGS